MSDELLQIARRVAAEAGELVQRRRREGVEVLATKSTSVDIVTAVDREAEALIRGMLADARPDDGFYGEESGAETGTSGLTWVVDPIDGTVNFLYGLAHYAVSIAVVEGEPDPLSWRAIAGCVHNPATGEDFHAMAGGGAHLGDRRLHVAPAVELSHALVGTGFSYYPEQRTRQAQVVANLIGKVRDIRRAGTASLDLCSVAAGRLDAYFEQGLNPWDHAAGALVAVEAGARVSGLRGTRANHEFLLAAGPSVAAALERVLVESGA